MSEYEDIFCELEGKGHTKLTKCFHCKQELGLTEKVWELEEFLDWVMLENPVNSRAYQKAMDLRERLK